jgi:hypothetical protein
MRKGLSHQILIVRRYFKYKGTWYVHAMLETYSQNQHLLQLFVEIQVARFPMAFSSRSFLASASLMLAVIGVLANVGIEAIVDLQYARFQGVVNASLG